MPFASTCSVECTANSTCSHRALAECQHGRRKSVHCHLLILIYPNHPCASCCFIKPSRKNHSWGATAHEVLVVNHHFKDHQERLGTLQTGALGSRQIAICRTCAGVQALSMTIQVTSQVLEPSSVVKLC